jgi:hypothetical protein
MLSARPEMSLKSWPALLLANDKNCLVNCIDTTPHCSQVLVNAVIVHVDLSQKALLR